MHLLCREVERCRRCRAAPEGLGHSQLVQVTQTRGWECRSLRDPRWDSRVSGPLHTGWTQSQSSSLTLWPAGACGTSYLLKYCLLSPEGTQGKGLLLFQSCTGRKQAVDTCNMSGKGRVTARVQSTALIHRGLLSCLEPCWSSPCWILIFLFFLFLLF